MTPRRKLLILPVTTVLAALLWTTFGTFSTAAGQESPATVKRAASGERTPAFERPIFIAVLGGDARDGNPERQGVDAIHILGIDPVKMRASIIGLPRDSYIPSPCGGSDKLTDIGRCAGIPALIEALADFSKCRFDYYMYTAFEGFRGAAGSKVGGLVNQMGGITLNVEKDYDQEAPVALKKGRQRLSGAEALSYTRNRKERSNGDFSRSEAQGKLMIAALQEARNDFKENPGTALRNLAVLRRNVRMDIGLREALQLGLMALKIDPDDVNNDVVEGRISSAGAASIVEITADGRQQLADICADGLLDQ